MRWVPGGAAGTAVVGAGLAVVLVSGVAVAAREAATGPAEPSAASGAPLDELPVAPAAGASSAPTGTPSGQPSGPASAAPSAPAAAGPVAPLGELRVPDLMVRLPAPLTPDRAAALRAVPGVQAVTEFDTGPVRVGGQATQVVGVDPSAFRAFTPQETAASDGLWQAVARGELAPSYGLARARKLPLGGTITVEGAQPRDGRVGAIAAYALPGVDLVTDRATARELGAAPGRAVLVSAPKAGLPELTKAVQAAVGSGEVEVLRPEPVAAAAAGGRPASYRELYIDSARYCPGMSWTVLAAIGQVESGHGRNLGPSSAGALGPMQFLPATWAAYGIDGDRDGKTDIMSPYDAVPSAAGYLCRFGANRGPEGLYDAIFAYNHADWYVQKVLATAKAYE